ncbi:MAG TPA: hypothetical protein VF623_04955 [Segetibacter sp.]|jgi:hypothetical protein
MYVENINQIINIISKGDTKSAEALFNLPGGRKHLESIVLIVISSLPYSREDKEELFVAFLKTLNKIEKRIKHQKNGQRILKQVYG